MTRFVAVGVGLLLASSSLPAYADEPAAEDDESATPTQPTPAPAPADPFTSVAQPIVYTHRQEPREKWYGWQTLVADGVAIASLPSGEAALAVYLGASPIIHFAHGNLAKGLGSFALRGGAPIGGALLGCAVTTGSNNCFEAAALGLLGGYLTAVFVDAFALAYTTEPAREVASTTLAPVATWTSHGGSIGLQGLF